MEQDEAGARTVSWPGKNPAFGRCANEPESKDCHSRKEIAKKGTAWSRPPWIAGAGAPQTAGRREARQVRSATSRGRDGHPREQGALMDQQIQRRNAGASRSRGEQRPGGPRGAAGTHGRSRGKEGWVAAKARVARGAGEGSLTEAQL